MAAPPEDFSRLAEVKSARAEGVLYEQS